MQVTRKDFQYKIHEKYIKTGWFSSRKYFLVIEISHGKEKVIKTMRVNEQDYYTMEDTGVMYLYTTDYKMWYRSAEEAQTPF
jgi:hypothetical protein